MKLKTKRVFFQRVTVSNDKRYITFEIDHEEIKPINTNLPYVKRISDWEFYQKAIKKALRENEFLRIADELLSEEVK